MEEKPILPAPAPGKEFEHIVECVLFVAGDPVPITELARVFSMPSGQVRGVSQSLLETLAIVAYRQPVTRAELESVRGVRCDYAVHSLLRLGLITEAGRRDVLGHPMQYCTTDRFLRQFGIHRVEEMPDFGIYSVPEPVETDGEEHPV